MNNFDISDAIRSFEYKNFPTKLTNQNFPTDHQLD